MVFSGRKGRDWLAHGRKKKCNTADGAARACGIGIAIVGHAGWGVRVGMGSILHFIETLLNFGTTPSEK